MLYMRAVREFSAGVLNSWVSEEEIYSCKETLQRLLEDDEKQDKYVCTCVRALVYNTIALQKIHRADLKTSTISRATIHIIRSVHCARVNV
jgi:hypothetical protein